MSIRGKGWRRAARYAVAPAAAAVVSLALMGAQGGCSSAPGGGGGAQQPMTTGCLPRISTPNIVEGPGWNVTGGVEVSCYQPFRSVINTLYVQWKTTNASQWENIGHDSNDSQEFPVRVVTGSHDCHVGSWRLRWTIDAVAKDGTRMHDEDVGKERYNTTCP